MSQRSVSLTAGKSTYEALLDLPSPLPSTLVGVILTHGAGGDMKLDSIEELALHLASNGVACLRFTCKSLDLGVRVKAFKAALEHLKNFQDSKFSSIFLAGRSMGSRAALQTSTELADFTDLVKGVICLAYPLRNPASAPPRIELLQKATLPTLFISGTNDNMCKISELQEILNGVAAKTTLKTLEGGDHSFKAKKSNVYSYDELKKQQNDEVLKWIGSLVSIEGRQGGRKRAREDGEEIPKDAEPSSSPSKKQAKLGSFFTPKK